MGRALILEELVVWRLACEFEDGVLALVRRTAAVRDFRFAGQITDAATSVPSNVSEGFHRFRALEFAQIIRYARASLGESEKRLRTGVRKGYFAQSEIDPLLTLAKRLGKGLMNFHDYLVRQGNATKARKRNLT